MEEIQTEVVVNRFDKSRNRRTIGENIRTEDSSSNDEEDYSTSGFYVREKTDSKSKSSDDDVPECKENGNLSDKNEDNNLSLISTEDSLEREPEQCSDPLANESVNGDKDQEEDTACKPEENSNIEENLQENDTVNRSNEESNDSNSNEVENEDTKSSEANEGCDDKNENMEEDSGKENDNAAIESEEKDISNKLGGEDVDTKNSEDTEKIESIEDDNTSSKDEDNKEDSEETDKTENKEDGKSDHGVADKIEKEDTDIAENKDTDTPENKNTEKIEKEDLDTAENKDTEKIEKEDTDKAENKSTGKIEKDDTDKVAIKDTDEEEIKDTDKAENKDPDENDSAKEPRENHDSLLKEQLTRSRDQSEKGDDNDEDMEYDFDPSLLCPDISMDVDEAPVITTNDNVPNDGSTSPLPYEQVFSTYVDEMTGAEISFNLTPEEVALREKMYGPNNPVQYTKIHCTACNVHLGSALDGQKNRFVHPLLKVLICKNCYHFYTSGEFEKDEDGSELYCRWCGQGGQVLCCSSCEFVFCKRCIKNNFGMKKFKEIRDSDDWNCFRCDYEQLSSLRASCAEFMDYVRREISRAATLIQDVPSFTSTDHTRCCSAPKQKSTEPAGQEPKKKKRKLSNEDPDYNPLVEEEKDDPPPALVRMLPVAPPATVPGPKPILVPRPMTSAGGMGPRGPPMVGQRPQMFRVGNTTFRPKQPYQVQRQPGPPPGQVRVAGPGYIKILPQRMPNARPHTVMAGRASTVRPTASNVKPGAPNVRPVISNIRTNVNSNMKHEWFEKTARAAARVNSNLSYTLTQLNRQQSSANSVEGLAVVHNKLQEVLSTSINSLIQIRKNLRTEFIAGIKTIKFPPKLPAPLSPKDDDDVIFVNPTTASQVFSSPAISGITLSPAVTLTSIKKTPQTPKSDLYSNPTPSTSFAAVASPSSNGTPERKGGYLKVKSFSALQNVTSECITIPDDPPPLAPFKTSNEKTGEALSEEKKVEEDGKNKKEEKSNVEEDGENKEQEKSKVEEDGENKKKEKSTNGEVTKVNLEEVVMNDVIVIGGENQENQVEKEVVTNGVASSDEKSNDSVGKGEPTVKGAITKSEELLESYNLKESPPPEIKRMLNACVVIKKSKEIDDLIKMKSLELNGGSD